MTVEMAAALYARDTPVAMQTGARHYPESISVTIG